MAFFDVTKTGRLKAPKRSSIPHDDFIQAYRTPDEVNLFGDPMVQVGDYVYTTGSISAGTVGKVIGFSTIPCTPDPMLFAEVELLSGQIKGQHPEYLVKCPYEAIQEVKDFYINDGRSSRIKVIW